MRSGGERIAIYTEKSTGEITTRYLHHDNQGSTVKITNELGAVIEEMSYGCHSGRRNIDWSAPATPITSVNTDRGYTDHEHLDTIGLIHMNGRVYDPTLGRFLSADPHIQFPGNMQSWNRYSYVLNNPHSYTDPSGFFLKSLFKAVGKLVKKVFRNKLVQTVATIAAAVYGGPGAAAAVNAGFTAINGGSLSDILKSAALTYASAQAFEFVGHQLGLPDNPAFLSSGHITKIFAHGVVGGTFSKLQGGSFQSGFLSATATQFAAPGISKIDIRTRGPSVARTIAAAVVGGVASVFGGGKFANGAVTGAFSRLFNDDVIQNKVRQYFSQKARKDYAWYENTVSGNLSPPFSSRSRGITLSYFYNQGR